MATGTMNKTFKNGDELVSYCIHEGIKQHPFFLNQNNYDLPHVWALLIIGRKYKRIETEWSLYAIEKVLDDPILLSLLVDDLDIDLGRGDGTKTHEILALYMLKELKPWALENQMDVLNKADARFAEDLAKYRMHKDKDITLGANLGCIIYGNTITDYMLKTLSSKKEELSKTNLKWFHEGEMGNKSSQLDQWMKISNHIAQKTSDLAKTTEGVLAVEKVHADVLDVLNHLKTK